MDCSIQPLYLETGDKTIRTTCPRRAVGMAPNVMSLGYLVSATRMELLVNAFEPRVVDVRVNLRGTDAGVAEHFLNLT